MSNSGRKRLLYIADVLPEATFGGAILMHRHLCRLGEEGWETDLIKSSAWRTNFQLEIPGRILHFARRRIWWPPSLPGTGMIPRMIAWLRTRHLLNEMRVRHYRAVLTVVDGPSAFLASWVAEQLDLPLNAFLHDSYLRIGKESLRQKYFQIYLHVLNKAARVWSVSPEIALELGLHSGSKRSVLYPIPSKHKSRHHWSSISPEGPPVLLHSGTLGRANSSTLAIVCEALKEIGGRIAVTAEKENRHYHDLARRFDCVERHDPIFDENRLMKWIRSNFTGICVVFPFDEPLRSQWRASFPSRFCQFTQLAIPMIVIAPPDSAIGKWLRARDWIGYVDSVDRDRVDEALSKLGSDSVWKAMSLQAIEASQKELDPERIQRQFVEELVLKP